MVRGVLEGPQIVMKFLLAAFRVLFSCKPFEIFYLPCAFLLDILFSSHFAISNKRKALLPRHHLIL